MLSLWDLLAGGLFALWGLVMSIMGSILLSERQFLELYPQVDAGPLGPIVLGIVVPGPFLLIIGMAMVLVGYGLYQGWGWAWTGLLVITLAWAGLGLLLVLLGGSVLIFMLVEGIVVLSIALPVLWYATRPGVRAWFGKAAPQPPAVFTYVPPPPPAGR